MKIGIVFAGQGAQYSGMGKDLYETYPEAKAVFEMAGDQVKDWCFNGDADTLKQEYMRDKNQGLDIKIPQNYFPDNDDTREPIVTWRSHANLIYQNWLNYFVYQATPYAIDSIGPVI